jgi:hypothetical protein
MALTKQIMPDEERKSVALEYLKAFDKAGVTPDDGRVLDLFAEDALVYFLKMEVGRRQGGVGRLFADVGVALKGIVHHYASFNWAFSGGDIVVCERTSHGKHKDGS